MKSIGHRCIRIGPRLICDRRLGCIFGQSEVFRDSHSELEDDVPPTSMSSDQGLRDAFSPRRQRKVRQEFDSSSFGQEFKLQAASSDAHLDTRQSNISCLPNLVLINQNGTRKTRRAAATTTTTTSMIKRHFLQASTVIIFDTAIT